MATTCVKCGGEITGDRYENALSVEGKPNLFFHPQDFMHFECVEDPARLHPSQFPKWAAHTIKNIQRAASQQLHLHHDLVDALEGLHPGTRAAYEQIVQRGLHEIVSQETDPR